MKNLRGQIFFVTILTFVLTFSTGVFAEEFRDYLAIGGNGVDKNLEGDLVEFDRVDGEGTIRVEKNAYKAFMELRDQLLSDYDFDIRFAKAYEDEKTEYRTGLLIKVGVWKHGDLLEITGKYAKTLRAIMADYGFIERYPQGKEEETGFPADPSIIRFVWSSEIAHSIMDEKLCLEEYLKEIGYFKEDDSEKSHAKEKKKEPRKKEKKKETRCDDYDEDEDVIKKESQRKECKKQEDCREDDEGYEECDNNDTYSSYNEDCDDYSGYDECDDYSDRGDCYEDYLFSGYCEEDDDIIIFVDGYDGEFEPGYDSGDSGDYCDGCGGSCDCCGECYCEECGDPSTYDYCYPVG